MSTPSTTSTIQTGSSYFDCCPTQVDEEGMFEELLTSANPSIADDEVQGFDTHQLLVPLQNNDTNEFLNNNVEDRNEFLQPIMPGEVDEDYDVHGLSAEFQAEIDALTSDLEIDCDISDHVFKPIKSDLPESPTQV